MSKNSFAIGRTMLCLLLVVLAVSASAVVGSVSAGATVICKSDMKFTAVWEKNPGAPWIDTNWPIVLVVSILSAIVLLCVAYLVYHRMKNR